MRYYHQYDETFEKIDRYVEFIRQYRDCVKDVHVSNSIEDYFGKRYCRVYVEIAFKLDLKSHFDLQQKLLSKFYNSSYYFSFFIGDSQRDYDEKQSKNEAESLHYEYIWHLLSWNLRNDGIPVREDKFVSEYDLFIENKKRSDEFDQRREVLSTLTKDLNIVIDQFIAIKGMSESPLRIAKPIKISLSIKRQSFSMELIELKSDLATGKREITLYSKNEIYAIVDPTKLSQGIRKPDLINLLNEGSNFEGLIWRRPQQYWE